MKTNPKAFSTGVGTSSRIVSKLGWLLGCLVATVSVRAELDPTRDKILYTVANSHLDTQWNWTIQSTIYPYLSNTLAGNFARFEKFPDYTFNFEGAFRYRLAKEYYPDHYETLKRYIATGRWRVAGSSVDAGDVVVPSPESLFRQALYGNGYFKQEFGKTSEDIFLPDCFGFPYSLPSIAAHSGLKGFSTAKLLWGSSIPIPFQNIGRWVGPDGASVVAVLQPGAYDSGVAENLATSSNYLFRIDRMAAATGLNIDYRYFGTGDVGGAPKESYVEWLEQGIQTTNGPIHVLSSSSDQLFRDLTEAQISKLPTYQGELLMRIHGVGCYTAHSEMKTYNRRNELWGDAAERASVIADWLQGGGTYPQEKLTKAWERFLWHQFHDDLTGTSIDAAYNFSWNDELLSLQDFATEQTYGVGVLAKALDTTAAGAPLVVFNPLSIEREDVVEAVVSFSGTVPKAVQVFDPGGREVPSQVGSPNGNMLPVQFLARVPANGAAVFDVRPSATASKLKTGLSVSPSQLENKRYRVQLNADGDVSSIFDKRHQRELLSAPIRWAFLPDLSIAWPAWEITYASLIGSPTYLGSPARVEVLENGPARVSLAVTRFKDGSAFTECISLAAGDAEESVTWDVSVNWHTLNTLLKTVFPLSVSNPQATFDLGLGTIQRGNATPNLYEVPAQQWADLTDTNGAYGVTIMNDSKYGWDKPNDRTLRLTIFHTPETGSAYPHGGNNSIGTHRLKFAVMGHANDWRSGQSPWAAARLNQPMQAFQTDSHSGALGKSFAFLTCDNSNVMVKAIKKAEASSEVVVRLQELTGQSQTALLACASPIISARDMTATEDPLHSLEPVDGKLTVSFTGYQPKTIALALAPSGSQVTKTESRPVALSFNLDGVSSDANRTDGNFDAGFTYPAELMPASLVREGVTFIMGPTNDGAFNAVSCQGQTIPLNASNYTQLYFLAAVAGEDTVGTFKVDGKASELTVQHFSGFIGQWNPPLLKKDEVGWVFTHRHTPAGNDPYRFCYWFKYRLDLPRNAAALTLPNSPNIRIFAMSLARGNATETKAAGGPLAANELPWANAGLDQRINTGADRMALVTLDATASADPDGKIVSYVWSENGMTLATEPKPTLSLGLGKHSILLTVTDDQGATSPDLVTVTVLTPLTVATTASPKSGSATPLTVQFAAKVSGGSNGLASFDTTDGCAGVVSAQGEMLPNEAALKLFDNRPATKWLDFGITNPATRISWVQYQYASGQRPVVTNYALTSASDAPARDPTNWRLLGSNDGGTNWITLNVQTNQTFSARQQRRAFDFPNAIGFSIYRLQIDRVANSATATSVQLAEIELIGAPVYVYDWNFGDGTTSRTQNPQHTYTNNGNFPVELALSCGDRTGTNRLIITVGPSLTATATVNHVNGNDVQFSGQASGGNSSRLPFDVTGNGLGTVSARGGNAPEEGMLKAFDGDPATKWLDFSPDLNTQSSWIQYRFANDWPHAVTKYAITSANDVPDRDPRDWQLLGSNDGGASWVTLDVRTNEVFGTRFERREFTVGYPMGYGLFRLQVNSVLKPTTAGSVQLSEIELIGVPGYSYSWSFGDGAVSTEQNPRHNYASAGPFTATLVVSDGLAIATNTVILPARVAR